MERTKTGIKGFDKLVDGGFPFNSTILLAGQPGTGKTIFALHYIYNGLKIFNEKCAYLTFEENKEDLFGQARQFGWELEKFEKSGALQVFSIKTHEIKKGNIDGLFKKIASSNVKRLVIDSVSSLSIKLPTTYMKLNEVSEFASSEI